MVRPDLGKTLLFANTVNLTPLKKSVSMISHDTDQIKTHRRPQPIPRSRDAGHGLLHIYMIQSVISDRDISVQLLHDGRKLSIHFVVRQLTGSCICMSATTVAETKISDINF